MTEPEPLQQINRTYVRYRGRTLSYFGGCDYFRLASHPTVLKAVSDGLRRYGLNVAASRLTTGHHRLYDKLEQQLAKFLHAEAALLVSTGYATNLAVAQALAGQFSHALVDERAHVSLTDAALWLDCPILKFKHRDADDFARTLRRCGRVARPIALTDGMFSHDGSVAPLRAYVKLLPRDSLLVVDDAHGAGTLGETGGGAVELEGVSRARVVQCVTLSKAFGVYGGAVICSRQLREQMVARSHLFVGSTPLPLPLANAACAALRIVRSNQTLRRRLDQNTAYVKDALRSVGFSLTDAPGPIAPIQFAKQRANTLLKKELLAARILPSFINYPGAPANGYFRFAISSEHSRRQLDELLGALAPFAGQAAASV
jgi:7-keto-8-aminopelargonate synthetase-like enzyme